MLQVMRDKVMGWLGWVIIGLIIITFALFGLDSYLQDKTRIYAARINDVEISPGELQNAYQQQRTQVQQMLGENFDPRMIDEDALRQRALNNLINRSLIIQAALSDGMTVSDQLLAAQIHATPLFQENGVFSEERYQRFLVQQGQPSAVFESDTRRGLLAEQLVGALSTTEFVTPTEVKLAYALQNQQRDFSYAIVSATQFEGTVEVDDAGIQQYYDEHGDQLMVPERVRLNYLRLTSNVVRDQVPVDETELQARYEEKKEALKTSEQRRASHILIQVASDADDEAVGSAKKEAESLLVRIRDGEDFAELARQHSGDPGSAANGGDLGFFAKGAMVGEFETAAFALEKGAVSDPVRTQFGFHIIKLVDIKGGTIPPFEEVRAELIAELQKQHIDDVFYENLEQLTDLSYESPESLDAAAENLGLEIQTSDWITVGGGPGIGAYPKVVNAAFSADVLEAGNNSEPVEVDNNDVIVVRVAEREPAHRPPLDSVRDEIIATLKKQTAAETAKAEGEAVLLKLSGGAALAEFQENPVLVITAAEGVKRTDAEYHPEVLRETFKLPRPEAGERVNHGMMLADGGYALIQLSAVNDGDSATMPEEAGRQIEQGYQNMRQSVNLTALLESLRARAEIVIPSRQENE